MHAGHHGAYPRIFDEFAFADAVVRSCERIKGKLEIFENEFVNDATPRDDQYENDRFCFWTGGGNNILYYFTLKSGYARLCNSR